MNFSEIVRNSSFSQTAIDRQINAQSIHDFPLLSTKDPTTSDPTLTNDKFCLLGLINIIRNDNDSAMLSLGIDLTNLGLNLSVQDPVLNKCFSSPFATDPNQGFLLKNILKYIGAQPVFQLPNCYSIQSPTQSILQKLTSFSEETLFYIFYSMPRDQAQEAASQELYNRGWRFHRELRLWLSKIPVDNTSTESNIVKGAGFERGVYLFFDPSSWSRVKKEWVLYYDQLEERGQLVQKQQQTATIPTPQQQHQQHQQAVVDGESPSNTNSNSNGMWGF